MPVMWKAAVPRAVVERNVRSDRRALHSGQHAHPLHELCVERDRLLVLVVAGLRQRESHGQKIARIEIDRLLLRAPKTFQGQSGAREEDHGEGDLRDDQSRSGLVPPRPSTAAARPSFMQGHGKRGVFRDPPRRPETDENSRAQGDGAGEEERDHIDARLLETRYAHRT